MDEGRRTFLAYEIMSGIKFISIGGERYKLTSATKEVRLLAEYVYQETVSSLRFDNLITNEKAKVILLGLNVWGEDDDEAYKKLETHLEDRKIELYESLYDSERQVRMRRAIKGVKKAMQNALARKHSLDYMTLEHHAHTTKRKFLVALGLRDMQNNPVYTEKSYWNADSAVLEQVISSLDNDIITIEEYRDIARHDPWRTIWSLGKEHSFEGPAVEWTDDQKMLMTFSRMYDNAYQSMDCPPDEVIADDDMFDGWMAFQRRKREKEQKQKSVETINNIPDKAQEVFLTAPTREDANKIYNMNDTEARMNIKERARYIEARQDQESDTDVKVRAEAMPDTQLELRRQQIQEYKDKMRGGR